MKICEYCGKSMSRTHIKRHQETCVFKVELNETKENVLKALSNHLKVVEEPARTDVFDLAQIELKNFLKDIYNRSKNLHKKVIEEDLRDPLDRIKDLHVAESTKAGYLVEYKLLRKWLTKNKMSLCCDSVNNYLASLKKCRTSTLKKKQMILQNLLRTILDPQLKLNPIRMKISYSSKYSMSDEEVVKYLQEQKSDHEMYLIQKLLITYGLRINTAAGLKLKHLHFLDDENIIFLPDTKTASQRSELMENEFAEEFRHFIRGRNLMDEDYIFLPEEKNQTVGRRANILCVLINNRISESRVIKKNPNFKYSSHMFRKTKANSIYQEGLRKLKEKSRLAIGQAKNSSAIEHYIN